MKAHHICIPVILHLARPTGRADVTHAAGAAQAGAQGGF